MGILENLNLIENRIQSACDRCSRKRDTVKLVGVSKKKPASAIVEALETTRLRDFGENYVQEYVEKRTILNDREANWHFIGHLQRNKVRQLMSFPPQLIHSVDSIGLIEQIERITGELYPEYRQPILLELRIGDEDGEKTGMMPSEMSEALTAISASKHLDLQGLMLIPPACENPEDVRPYFKELHRIFDSLCEKGLHLSVLSYGMSHDFEVAIEEGATHIRIGTAIFGERS
ncbi:MAG: YggS family pyridoxal phosphate-dependent enzyme [Proteobacteria bacterium]|nr:YggS family pyridoxal phosphate-dependent enzyme [Pseudomonadota bacterium]